MKIVSKKYNPNWPTPESLPFVSILLAAHNEEDNIVKRIETTLSTNYPATKFEFIIGSDASTDKTDSIIREFAKKDDRIKFIRFDKRTGKPEIINKLVIQARGEILILTDADTRFNEATILELVKPFAKKSIGGVQSHIVLHQTLGDVGATEMFYNNGELALKKGESVSGNVIGAFGSGYAIRKELYTAVPKGFLVDDFLIFCKVLLMGYKNVYAEHAITYMPIDSDSKTQFKRKLRISIGNFQNLKILYPLLNPFKYKGAYSFLSHKVIRWIGPFLLISIFCIIFELSFKNTFFSYLLLLQFAFYVIAILDLLLRKITSKSYFTSFIGHFVSMNFALLLGFLKFLTSKPDGTWSNK